MKIVVFVPVYEDVVQDAQIFVGLSAEGDAEKAFQDHTRVPYKEYAAAEDRDEVLRKSDTIGSYVLIKEVPVQVEIKVEKGLAEVDENPYEIDVTINDLDLDGSEEAGENE